MFYTIYKITNKLNSKYYIGMHKTSNLNDGYMGSGKFLKRAINKHGIENFEKEILFIFDNEQKMLDKEKELVIVSENTYNLCEGGKGGFGYINRNNMNGVKFHTKETKQKISNFIKNKIRNDNEYYLKLKNNVKKAKQKSLEIYPNNTFYGKKHTEETKEKMRIANKQQGSKNSQFGTMWITNGIDNKKIKKDLDTIPDGWYKGRN